jgi:pimeloyl-ACP methyl ester carboxylesterase
MRKVVSRDGTTIAYERAGDGPPIVLLNGAFRDHTIFDFLVPELVPHCTTYVCDRRGRGESGDSPAYTVQREIEDLEAVIEEVGPRWWQGSGKVVQLVRSSLAGLSGSQA